MCLYRLATEDEKKEILGNIPPLARGWKIIYKHPANNVYYTMNLNDPVIRGWKHGMPYYTILTGSSILERKQERYWPYIRVFIRPPEGSWKHGKFNLVPVYFWKDDVTVVGFHKGELVKKVNYPDPEKYFSLLEQDS